MDTYISRSELDRLISECDAVRQTQVNQWEAVIKKDDRTVVRPIPVEFTGKEAWKWAQDKCKDTGWSVRVVRRVKA